MRNFLGDLTAPACVDHLLINLLISTGLLHAIELNSD